jgi:TPR repeat protein
VAQNNLGLIFLSGKMVPRNLPRAFELFSQAAQQEDHWGLNNLAGMHEMGWGTQADRRRALELYRRAADLGNPHARKNIARLEAAAEQASNEQGGDGMETDGRGAGRDWARYHRGAGRWLAEGDRAGRGGAGTAGGGVRRRRLPPRWRASALIHPLGTFSPAFRAGEGRGERRGSAG